MAQPYPMKGPMVTQTLQDIIGHEPFHWRGDRDGLEKFAPTFKTLQGREEELSSEEMAEFKDFLATITFPPNPFRNLDNTLPSSINTNEKALGRGILAAGKPLPRGNAPRGLQLFRGTTTQSCIPCHTLPVGVGADAQFINGRWQNVPLGTNNEHHVAMVAQRRTSDLPFKVQQLRNLFDKVGFDLDGPVSRSGFGFFHDGRVDTLTRFLQDSFNIASDQDTADIVAFLLAFTGSDLLGGNVTDPNRAPGLPSRDAPAGAGFQSSVTNNVIDSRTQFMVTFPSSAPTRLELVAHGWKSGQPRGWLMTGSRFISDKAETNSLAEVLALAAPETPLVFTLVPLGSGIRLALDRDGDGFFNEIEIEAGSDPLDAAITPETTTPRLQSFRFEGGQVRLEWAGRVGSNYRIQTRTTWSPDTPWTDHGDPISIVANPAVWTEAVDSNAPTLYFRIVNIP